MGMLRIKEAWCIPPKVWRRDGASNKFRALTLIVLAAPASALDVRPDREALKDQFASMATPSR